MAENSWTRGGGEDAALAGIKYWQGTWVTATLYVKGDGVYNPTTGSSYVCIVQHTASSSVNKPGEGSDWSDYWNLVARGVSYTPEVPDGVVDGENVIFQVSTRPICVIYMGIVLLEGANGYSYTEPYITMPYAPSPENEDQFKILI
jgi:hypothetical protein